MLTEVHLISQNEFPNYLDHVAISKLLRLLFHTAFFVFFLRVNLLAMEFIVSLRSILYGKDLYSQVIP